MNWFSQAGNALNNFEHGNTGWQRAAQQGITDGFNAIHMPQQEGSQQMSAMGGFSPMPKYQQTMEMQPMQQQGMHGFATVTPSNQDLLYQGAGQGQIQGSVPTTTQGYGQQYNQAVDPVDTNYDYTPAQGGYPFGQDTHYGWQLQNNMQQPVPQMNRKTNLFNPYQ